MLKKKENQLRKMRQRMKAFEKTNNKLDENIKGKIASFQGRKS